MFQNTRWSDFDSLSHERATSYWSQNPSRPTRPINNSHRRRASIQSIVGSIPFVSASYRRWESISQLWVAFPGVLTFRNVLVPPAGSPSGHHAFLRFSCQGTTKPTKPIPRRVPNAGPQSPLHVGPRPDSTLPYFRQPERVRARLTGRTSRTAQQFQDFSLPQRRTPGLLSLCRLFC